MNKPNEQYAYPADDAAIEKAAAALNTNGMRSFVVPSGEEARQKVLQLIPEGSQVMTMTSQTLEAIGIVKDIMESGRFRAVRKKIAEMSDETQALEKRQFGAAPPYVVGSVHALTQDGHALIASNTGSQLPAYAYGALHVIWVVGTQKIVKNTEEGLRRIYEYSLPLEDERARKAYGVGSSVNKVLIVNKEFTEGRINVIIVKEKLGF